MKQELQNLVARYKNRKRDKKGRFTSGTGGIRFPKDFNWGRALPVILVVALAGGYLVWQSFAATSVTPPNWKLYWSDEFNASSLDTSRWGAYHNTYGDGNKEEACLTPSNVTSSNGTLKITSKKEAITCPGATQDQFSSGFIGSRDAPAKVYYPAFARYEIRAKVPHAQGLWPAFWLRHVGGSSVAEIDVMEYFHAQVPGKITQTLHLPQEVGRNIAKKSSSFETARAGVGDWHTYRVDIVPFENDTKAQLIYYIDGVETLRYTPTAFGWLNNYDKNRMFDIALNVAVGGTWNGHPDDPLGWSRYLKYCLNPGSYGKQQPCNGEASGVYKAQFPSSYEIDYVRVYTPDTSPVQPAPTPAPAPVVVKLPAPSNFKATPNTQGVSLSWDSSTDSRVTSYSARYIRSDSSTKSDGSTWIYPGRVSSTTQALSGLTAGVSYDFQIRSIDDTGVNPASDYTASVLATPLAPTPTGLSATYYTRTGFTGNFVSRVDQNINFSWVTNGPVSGIGENFSVRYTGQIVPTKTDDYTFVLKADEGAQLWVAGQPLIDAQKITPLTEKTGTVRLEAGKAYDFDLDFFDTVGNAQIQLFWKTPTMAQAIVPATVFRPIIKSGLSARYSSRGAVVKNYLLRNDLTVNFDWGTGSPASVVPADNFRGVWVGKLTVPTTGTYKLVTTSDDGVQFWVNNDLRINDWYDHSTKRNETTLKLEKGKQYAISLRYYEHLGGSNVKLLWSGPGITESVIPSTALTTN